MAHLFIISTNDKARFSPLAEGLRASIQAEISWAESGKAALEQAAATPPFFMVIDESLPDMAGVELAREVLQKNALINTALVSELSPEDFHEFSEGLGVLLQLPLAPGEKEARDIVTGLRGIFALPPE